MPRRVTLADEVLRATPQIEALEDVSPAELRTELSAQGLERVEMDDGGSASQDAHRLGRIPASVLPSPAW